MKHAIVLDDATPQGKKVLELINSLELSDNHAIEFIEDWEVLIPADNAFDQFDKALEEEYSKRNR